MTDYFTDAERAEAVQRYVAGESSLAVARSIGCSVPAVLDWLRAAGAPVRTRAQAQALKPRAALKPAKPNPRSTQREPKHDAATRNAAAGRYAAGESSNDIGRDFHVTGRTVRAWASAAGVPVRTRNTSNHWRAAKERVASRGPSSEPGARKKPGPPAGHATQRSDIQDDDESTHSVRRLMPVVERARGAVTVELVHLEAGEVRLIARATAITGELMQHSWDVEDVDHWSRGVLLLLSRAVAPRTHLHREGRHVR